MNKPSSKVIQISTIPSLGEWEFVALCEDSSIWSYSTSMKDANERWQCILEAPAQPKSDLPEAGSKWIEKKYGCQIVVDKVVKRHFGAQVEYSEILPSDYGFLKLELMIEEFLEQFEPIPTQSDNKE